MIEKHKVGECQLCFENVGVQNLRKSGFSQKYVCTDCIQKESEADFEYKLDMCVSRMIQ